MSIRPLPTALEEKAKKDLNETANKVKDIEHIRQWAVKQPHLTPNTDDQWLLAFLRGCKFSLQRTKEKLDTYYTVRKLIPEFFSNRDPFDPTIQEALKLGVIAILPKTADPAGPRVMISRGQNADPSKASVTTMSKLFFMAFDILLLEDDNFTVGGLHFSVDFHNVSYKYATQLTFDYGKKMTMCVQNVYPIRLKHVLFFNTPPFFVAFYSISKIFVKEKLLKRIHVADNGDELYKTLPRSVLPQEYGGDGGSFDQLAADFKTKVESYRDWFLKDAANCTDESKRIGKSNNCNDMLGIDGSFRKLDID